MFPFKATTICKIQLRTDNQFGKGQEEKALPPSSKDTRCNLIQNSKVAVKSPWVQTYGKKWTGITKKMQGQRIQGAEKEGPWDLVRGSSTLVSGSSIIKPLLPRVHKAEKLQAVEPGASSQQGRILYRYNTLHPAGSNYTF